MSNVQLDINQSRITYPQKCMEAWLGPVAVNNHLFRFLKIVDKIRINSRQLWSLHMPTSMTLVTRNNSSYKKW